MTPGDDFHVMGPPLDDRGADTLLAGDVLVVPDGWGAVARELDALRAFATPTAAPDALLDRMQVATGSRRRLPAPATLRRRAVAAFAGVAVALVGFGGLAAANALPPVVQRFVSNTLDHVGVSVPAPADDGPAPDPVPHQGTGDRGASVPGPATGADPDGGPVNTGTAPVPDGSASDPSIVDTTGRPTGAPLVPGPDVTGPDVSGPDVPGPDVTAPNVTAPVSAPSGASPGPGSAGGVALPGSTSPHDVAVAPAPTTTAPAGSTASHGASATAPGHTGAHTNNGNGQGNGNTNGNGNGNGNANGTGNGNGNGNGKGNGNGAAKAQPSA